MAEAIGLVVGFVGLAGLFSTCVDCFGWVQLYRSHDEDYNTFQTMLDNQQFHFMAWGLACGFMETSPDRRFDAHDPISAHRNKLIKNSMEEVQALLTNADILAKKYGLVKSTNALQLLGEVSPSAFSRAFQRTQRFWDTSLQRKSKLSAKLMWAVGNAEKFESLIARLQTLIGDLAKLTDDIGTATSQRLIVEYEIEMISEEANLEAISAAGAHGDDDLISSVARRQLNHVRQRSTVSHVLLQPDDSASMISHFAPSATNLDDSERLIDTNGSYVDQPVGIHRVSEEDWRKLKTRQGYFTWLPTLLVAESSSASTRSMSTGPGIFDSTQAGLVRPRPTRVAINARLLLKELRRITGAKLIPKRNVLVYPLKILVIHREAIVQVWNDLAEQYGSQMTDGPLAQTLPTIVGPTVADEPIRLLMELKCMVEFILEDLADVLIHETTTYETFDRLWLRYRPGKSVVTSAQDVLEAQLILGVTGGRRVFQSGKDQVNVTVTMDPVVADADTDAIPTFTPFFIYTMSLDYNGHKMGPRFQTHHIQPYLGRVRLSSLPVVPFDLVAAAHSSLTQDDLESKLTRRGRRYIECLQKRHLDHAGPVAEGYWTGHSSECGHCRSRHADAKVHGAVVIDHALALTQLSGAGCEWFNERHELVPVSHLPHDRKEVFESVDCPDQTCSRCTDIYNDFEIDDGQYRIARSESADLLVPASLGSCDTPNWKGSIYLPDRLSGYSLADHQWYPFRVDSLKDMMPVPRPFDGIVLPLEHKDLISAFVRRSTRDFLGDIGLGSQGTILLYHGPPSVGKTITARATAALVGTPVLEVTAANLGTSVDQLHDRLKRFIALAIRWNLTIVFDAVDTFLQGGERYGRDRDMLMIGFLHEISIFSGLAILVTNRVGLLAEAAISRVDLAIQFPALDKSSSTAIWQRFLQQIARDGNVIVDVEDILSLVQTLPTQLDGRQIRNAVAAGIALAGQDDGANGIHLRRKHVQTVLVATIDFSQYMESVAGLSLTEMATETGVRNDGYTPQGSWDSVMSEMARRRRLARGPNPNRSSDPVAPGSVVTAASNLGHIDKATLTKGLGDSKSTSGGD